MALPFMSLWSLVLLDGIATHARYLRLAWVALITSMAISYASNVIYLRTDNNAAQLELVARAELLLAPDERVFRRYRDAAQSAGADTLWLDGTMFSRHCGKAGNSEAYNVFSKSPRSVLWSYRMDNIYPVVAPLIVNSYVSVAPNLRIAGCRLNPGEKKFFDVPIAGSYALYSATGAPLQGSVEIDGAVLDPPFHL